MVRAYAPRAHRARVAHAKHGRRIPRAARLEAEDEAARLAEFLR